MRPVRDGGQSAIEYLVAVSLLSLALVAGSNSPLQTLFDSLRSHWASFTYAISRP